MEPKCTHCQTPLKGRADKKFCNDQCRASFNNLLRSKELLHLKQVNQILKKNRAILKERHAEKNLTTKDKLTRKGFNFGYHTHAMHNQDGTAWSFCYEYGYLSLENGEMLLTKEDVE